MRWLIVNDMFCLHISYIHWQWRFREKSLLTHPSGLVAVTTGVGLAPARLVPTAVAATAAANGAAFTTDVGERDGPPGGGRGGRPI